jgi:hypothetical protein
MSVASFELDCSQKLTDKGRSFLTRYNSPTGRRQALLTRLHGLHHPDSLPIKRFSDCTKIKQLNTYPNPGEVLGDVDVDDPEAFLSCPIDIMLQTISLLKVSKP